MLQPMMEDLFLARPSNPAEVRTPNNSHALNAGRVGRSAG